MEQKRCLLRAGGRLVVKPFCMGIFAVIQEMTMRMHYSPEEELLQEVLIEEGPIKELVLHNDEVNTFNHVIMSLVEICGHELMQATQCAHIVHNNGKCSVKRGTYDQLEPMCTSLHQLGLSADID
jgi:ATP-dependent Clp protease adaptor protein ClpS